MSARLEIVDGGGTIGCILRIGAPQLEKLDYATSVILPPVGAPAQATRAGELVTMTPVGFSAAAGMTLAVEYALTTRVSTALGELFAVGDNAGGHLVGIRDNGTNVQGAIQTASTVLSGGRVAVSAGTTVKAAVRATAGAVALAYNGVLDTPTVASGLPGAFTRGTLMIPFANRANPVTDIANGHIRKVSLLPRALSDAEMVLVP
jgi:hypothetical protein